MVFKECLGCKKRYPACQDHCESYLTEKRQQQERSEKIYRARYAEYEERSYIREHYEKMRRK